jgi:hypothetical protein
VLSPPAPCLDLAEGAAEPVELGDHELIIGAVRRQQRFGPRPPGSFQRKTIAPHRLRCSAVSTEVFRARSAQTG